MDELALFSVTTPEKNEIIGDVEQSFKTQIEYLEKTGVMNAAQAGLKTLVLRSARAVDRIKPTDAASGQANLIKALNEVSARLPEPKSEEVSVIDRLTELFAADTDEPGPFDVAPTD